LFLNDLSGGKTWEIHVVIDMGDAKIASTRVSLGDFPQAFQMVSLSGSIIWQLRVTDVDQNNKLETLPGGYVTRAPQINLDSRMTQGIPGRTSTPAAPGKLASIAQGPSGVGSAQPCGAECTK
jgi:hypothetical protein